MKASMTASRIRSLFCLFSVPRTAAFLALCGGVVLGCSVVSHEASAQVPVPGLGIINTVAGTAFNTTSGIPATSAGLNKPFNVTIDSAGNVYFSDTYNNIIRKVTVSTGVVTTVAGNGVTGFGGDGGVATAAKLDEPGGVALDSSGNLYIADSMNCRIRKVATTGIITTVAGNGICGYSGDGAAATAAELYGPDGLSVDSSGNMYIADTSNARVRKITVSTGIISTIAGNGTCAYSGDGAAATAAELCFPEDVALDTSGNLYIADSLNNRIRKVLASTGIISTLAGNGTGGLAGDGGPATAAELSFPEGIAVDASGNVYISDDDNQAIRKVTASTGVITSVAGNGVSGFLGDGSLATGAELSYPVGIAVDASGNIYIDDCSNYRIRKITASTGIISTIAGSGPPGGHTGDGGSASSATFDPWAVALDSSGNIYIADYNDQYVRKVTASTGLISTVAGVGTIGYTGNGGAATSAQLAWPMAVTVDSAGNVYIADSGNSVIRKVTASTGIISTVAGNGTAGNTGDGGPATSAELSSPSGLAIDNSGNLYIASGSVIRKVTASTGIITTVAGNGTTGYTGDGGPATSAELSYPDGIAVDSAGNLYITDPWVAVIRKVTASTGTISTIAGNGIGGYTGDGGPATSAELNWPEDVAVDSAGNIYIVDQSSNVLRKITVSTGIISTIAGNGLLGFSGDGGLATSSELAGPAGVALDASGNIYISDNMNYRVRAIGANKVSVKITVATSGTPSSSGSAVTFTATISNGVSGTVTFLDGTTTLGTGTISGTTATFTTSTLTVGTHSITASWPGNTSYSASVSAAITQTVNALITPTLTVATSGTPAVVGKAVTFTATISSGPTGTITFLDGTTTLGTGTISGTTAKFTTSTLAVGTHSIKASWPGNANYLAVTSSVITQTITQAPPTITVASSVNPSTYGSSVTFTATISSGPTGTLTFKDGTTTLGTGTISGTTATLATSTLAAGTHSITASWAGNATYPASTSPALTQTVNKATAVVTWATPAAITYGVALTSTQLNATANVPGTFTYTPAAGTIPALGSDTLSVTFSSPNIVSSVTKTVTLTVNKATPSLKLTSSVPSPIYGQTEVLTAAISNSLTGTVAFTDGGTSIGAGTIASVGAAAPSAELCDPDSIALDGTGNVYSVNSGCSVIRVLTSATGTIATVAGNGTNGYSGDGGQATTAEINLPSRLAVDSSGNIYIADGLNGRVRRVTAATGIITTIAGTGTQSYTGDGGAGVSAGLNNPSGVAVDSSGNTYIADTANNRIRKVTAATGIITTVAGTGTAGFAGDGALAVNAGLYLPQGVAVDSAGNFYIADFGNSRIRKVTASTGIITTVAGSALAGYSGDGGLATSAEINSPYGVAVDASGNLYIPDWPNQRIRKVTASTGIITTVAGNGTAGYTGDGGPATSATLNDPFDVAVDSSGNLYIADGMNERIRKVTASTNIISTIAGNGARGYSGDAQTSATLSISTLKAGAHSLAASWPGAGDFNAASSALALTIAKATPTVSWATPAPITYGTALSSAQLNAGLSVAGSCVYTPAAGAVLSAGTQTLSVTCTPTDTTDYNTPAALTVSILVNKAPWATPTVISLSPASGAVGASATITGTNFGTGKGTSIVTFNGAVAQVLSWGSSSITAVVPSNAATGPVVITLANGQPSNANVIFTVTGSTSSCP